jgi:co-chaperonin GroES (HSP10)
MTVFVNRIEQLRPIRDDVLVTEMTFDERITQAGIIIPHDDGKTSGIRPRWGRVFAIGPEQQEIKIGQWICVAHGRWTRGVTIDSGEGQQVIRKVDNDDILLVSDIRPNDETISDKY